MRRLDFVDAPERSAWKQIKETVVHIKILSALATLPLLIATAEAQTPVDLFRGAEISLLVGAGPGGGADTYARLLARHYGSFLPGAPSVVVRNVPGAGGLKLANQIYNVAPKDGTEIASFLTSTALEPLFGNKDANFETTKFTWIGNMASDDTACVAWKTTGIRTWQDLRGRTTIFGASGPASTASIQAKIVGALLDVPVKVVHGYQGTRTSLLAMQRGELDAVCGLYLSTIRAQFGNQVANGDLRVWMTFGKARAEEFPDVATVYEMLHDAADLQLADLIFGQDALSWPVCGPPEIPADRVEALRKGFAKTMVDPAFLLEAKKAGLDIRPMTGEETQARYAAFYATPKSVIERAITLIGDRNDK